MLGGCRDCFVSSPPTSSGRPRTRSIAQREGHLAIERRRTVNNKPISSGLVSIPSATTSVSKVAIPKCWRRVSKKRGCGLPDPVPAFSTRWKKRGRGRWKRRPGPRRGDPRPDFALLGRVRQDSDVPPQYLLHLSSLHPQIRVLRPWRLRTENTPVSTLNSAFAVCKRQ